LPKYNDVGFTHIIFIFNHQKDILNIIEIIQSFSFEYSNFYLYEKNRNNNFNSLLPE